MKIKEVLELNPKKEYEICYDGTNVWKQAYFQRKENEIDPNDLPVLDNEYLGHTGELLYNNKGEAVFDPTQEIEYDFQLGLEYEKIYKSKTFIGLLQQKIKELIESGELSDDSEDYEVLEALDTYYGPGFLEELFDSVGCNDQVCIEDTEGKLEDWLLWYSSTLLDDELGGLSVRAENASRMANDETADWIIISTNY